MRVGSCQDGGGGGVPGSGGHPRLAPGRHYNIGLLLFLRYFFMENICQITC